ncbi:MAG: WecB/TagA/CpsF family glycosyltransferase [bacterium]
MQNFDYIYILGVKLHKIKKEDILKKINEWLAGDKFNYITTVNPEFVLEAPKDEDFKKILNNADLSIPDGIGLKFAAWIFGRNIYRVAGSDLTKDILKLAEQKSCSLYFFVWKYGLSNAEEVKDQLKHTPNFKIDGQAIELDGSDIDWEKFNNFKPDIILAGLGASHQEKLIARMKEKGGIKVAMGVGGTFDFLTKKTKRAPKIMRIFGIEWLYRMCQPSRPPHNYFYRAKRIFNAVLIFTWHIVKWKIRMSFKYRRGVTAVIIEKGNRILLCQRSDDLMHWQFPKGGMERGENGEDAVKREILEEVGLRNIKIIKKLVKKDKYSYNYPRGQGNLIKLKNGFKGQISDIFIVRFLGGEEIKIDNKEFADYKWVNADELLENLHPIRKEVGEIVFRELEKLLGIKN